MHFPVALRDSQKDLPPARIEVETPVIRQKDEHRIIDRFYVISPPPDRQRPDPVLHMQQGDQERSWIEYATVTECVVEVRYCPTTEDFGVHISENIIEFSSLTLEMREDLLGLLAEQSGDTVTFFLDTRGTPALCSPITECQTR